VPVPSSVEAPAPVEVSAPVVPVEDEVVPGSPVLLASLFGAAEAPQPPTQDMAARTASARRASTPITPYNIDSRG
jgi:hypothetical protein